MELVLQHVRAKMRGNKYVGIIWIQSKIFELKTAIYVARRAGFEIGGGATAANRDPRPTAVNGKHYLIKKNNIY